MIELWESRVGSPPCVRGAEPSWVARLPVSRFTPVRTGSRRCESSSYGLSTVHPRAYGEQVSLLILSLADLRFTPVRTGSSSGTAIRSQGQAVHPRAYGEQGDLPSQGMTASGSPPCVRGAV